MYEVVVYRANYPKYFWNKQNIANKLNDIFNNDLSFLKTDLNKLEDTAIRSTSCFSSSKLVEDTGIIDEEISFLESLTNSS